jgi:class 3 adenylate cyclase
VSDGKTGVRTFLIADVRGYSRFTEEYGDEAAARLAATFAELVAEEVDAHGGGLVEIRGDEALAVFTSARQAIRAGVDLQARFEEEDSGSDLPLRVGIGIESGEAVELEDGSFRGAALNVAARLCGRAHGGEVLVSASTSRLAGRLTGLQYVDQGKVRLKNIPEPIQIFKVYSELGARPSNRWVVMFFGKQPRRALTWGLVGLVALIAAGTAALVVFLTTNDHGERSSASTRPTTGAAVGAQSAPLTPPPTVANPDLAQLVPAELWKDCRLQTVPDQTAVETAVCLPPASATHSSGAANAPGSTGRANRAAACSATSRATTLLPCGHTRASDRRATETSSRSHAKAAATTRASPGGGARGITGSARRTDSGPATSPVGHLPPVRLSERTSRLAGPTGVRLPP